MREGWGSRERRWGGTRNAGVEREILGWNEKCLGKTRNAGVEREMLGWNEKCLGGTRNAGVERATVRRPTHVIAKAEVLRNSAIIVPRIRVNRI